MSRRRSRCLAVIGAFAAGCGNESPPLDPIPQVAIDLVENVWRRELVVAAVSVEPLDVVTEIRLEVDGVVVGTIPPATLEPPMPEPIAWDSRTVVDGEHTWRVVATTATGRSGEDSVTFLTDNTAPTITLVGQSATETPLELQFAVVENESGLFNAGLRVGDGATVAIDRSTWRASLTGCIRANLQAFVTDRAGNSGVYNFRLDALDACDRDCDGVRSTGACGGLDCNDAVTSIPDTVDTWGEGLDTNCDGVDGTDGDGDGVPGATAGTAPDCNDGVASIHGYWSNWSRSPRLGFMREDHPDTALAFHGEDVAVLYPPEPSTRALDFTRRTGGVWTPSTRLGSSVFGQDVALVHDAGGHVHGVFASNGVTYVTSATGTMTSEVIAQGSGAHIAVDAAGVVNILFEGNGTNVEYHARKLPGGWSIATLPFNFGSTERGSLFVQNGVLTFVHRDGSAIEIERFVNDAWVTEAVTAPGASYLRAAPMGSDIIIAAAGSQSRTHVFGGPFGPWPGVSFPYFGGYGTLTVGADDRVHLVYEPLSGHGLHHVYSDGVWYVEPTTMGMSPIGTDATGRAHAAANAYLAPEPSGVYLLTEQSPVLPPADAVGDGVDQDCDGVDG